MNQNDAQILVVGDNSIDAEQVCNMLRERYPHIQATTDPAKSDMVFDRVKPQILVLSFKSLDACERFYLGLFRRSEVIHALSHRTVVLCSKEDVRSAFDLCIQSVFDDYVLFWPLVHDPKRLAMSIHLALSALVQERSTAPMQELVSLARRAELLEEQLAEQVKLGRLHARNAQATARKAQASVSRVMGDLSERILATGLDNALAVRDAPRVEETFDSLQRKTLLPTLEEVVRAAQPVCDWVETITSELAEPLQANRDIIHRVRAIRPQLLVVDDDEYMRRLLMQLLTSANYKVDAVGSAAEAQRSLAAKRPDLILLDLMLPDSNGILLLREIKGSPPQRDIPVIMLTGKTEKQVIVESRKSGAVDLVAKPFSRDVLLKKIALHLGKRSRSAADV